MKLHIGVDAALGLTHSLSTTAANTADAPRLDGVAGRDASRTPPHAAARQSAGPARAGFAAGQGRAPVPLHQTTLRLRQQPTPAKAGLRYRGLAKNHQRLALPLGFTNLLIAEPRLGSTPAHCAPGPARPQPSGQPDPLHRATPSSPAPVQLCDATAHAESGPNPIENPPVQSVPGSGRSCDWSSLDGARWSFGTRRNRSSMR